jgi:flagellar basal-body rod modification protein FlgD
MSSVSSTASSTASVNGAGGAMGEQQFLTLLVAQLKNQDPMKPMDNTAFVSQLAQFSALQQEQANGATQTSLLTNDQTARAEGMVGRTVGYSATAGGATTNDLVMGATNTSSGVQLLMQSGASIPLSSITTVY